MFYQKINDIKYNRLSENDLVQCKEKINEQAHICIRKTI
jgi:hypothetical protein